ncbi:hypothetical protein P280DRAFT_212410 [Massarina eburnea CBS 473.64]|uniref:Uncharacterized protein n=1 Tax=Massarina eburnea CBS 473.64 TaxID=1395130 RepID=A0A6A6RI99_9PLEO|nr:hypothetical protein P280DRAFT_212410 [Massarina eburnea CBS 473.64]
MKDVLPILSSVLSLCALSNAHGVQYNHPRYVVNSNSEYNITAPTGTRSYAHPISRLPANNVTQNATSHATATTLKSFVKASVAGVSNKKASSTAKAHSASKATSIKSSSTSKASSAIPKASSTTKPSTTSQEKSSTSSKTSSTSAIATDSYDYAGARLANSMNCQIFDPPDHKATTDQCYNACKSVVEEAKKEERTTSYGCVSFTPLNEKVQWYKWPGAKQANYTMGKCSCDNALVNEIADTVIEALPAIAQIGCFIVMSSLRLVFEKALEAIPEVGTAVNAGMKALIYAANLVKYAYDASQAPADAFDFWLSPCGGSDYVPQQLKDAFDLLQQAGDVIDFEPPKKIKKASGKKGDSANPKK